MCENTIHAIFPSHLRNGDGVFAHYARIAAELEALIVRLARENPRWGYGKLQGELMKLGYLLGESTIRDVLKRQHIPSTPRRSKRGNTWRALPQPLPAATPGL